MMIYEQINVWMNFKNEVSGKMDSNKVEETEYNYKNQIDEYDENSINSRERLHSIQDNLRK